MKKIREVSQRQALQAQQQRRRNEEKARVDSVVYANLAPGYWSEESPAGNWSLFALARELGMSAGAVHASVERLRRRKS